MSKRSFEVFLSFFLFLSFRIKKYVKDASSEMVFEAGMKDWLCFSLVSSGFVVFFLVVFPRWYLVTRVLFFLMFSGMTTCPVLTHPCLEPSSRMKFLQATQVTGAISSLEPSFLLHCLSPIICQLSIFYFITITAAKIYFYVNVFIPQPKHRLFEGVSCSYDLSF